MASGGRPVTQLFLESLQTNESAPSASTPILMPEEPQRPIGSNQSQLKKEKKDSARQERQETPGKALQDQIRDPNPVSIRQRGDPAAQPLVIRKESPWTTLEGRFTCDLAGPVSIAVHRTDPSRILAVRAFSKKNAGKLLQILQQSQHSNIHFAREIFNHNGVMYAIVDDLPLTLENLVASDAYPSELQLASILAQV